MYVKLHRNEAGLAWTRATPYDAAAHYLSIAGLLRRC
jgi:hypothetical protein